MDDLQLNKILKNKIKIADKTINELKLNICLKKRFIELKRRKEQLKNKIETIKNEIEIIDRKREYINNY